MNRSSRSQVVALILLGTGVFQILAVVLLAFFWLVTGDWRQYWPHAIGIAFWLNLPVSYWLWNTYQRARSPKR